MPTKGAGDAKRARRRSTAMAVGLEAMEARTLLSTASISFSLHPQMSARPFQGPELAGFVPSQIRQAYGFDQIGSGAPSANDGSGQTIAIVEAYSDPNLATDLHVFDQQFALNDPPSLQQVSQNDSTQLPQANPQWAGETALDVEWAHAMAPQANILVVDANSQNLSDLASAVETARNAPGVSVVSMSWGGSEFQQESSFDDLFTTPPGHQGISFVAASGDSGQWGGPQWPATSGNVISVGGTHLSTDAQGEYVGETAWSGSGGGVSSYEPEPTYQLAVQSTGARTTPDVSYDADPNSGYYIYCSIADQGSSGWQIVGGTSAGAPQWAALIAVANQGRAAAGLTTLDGATQTLPALYQATATGFHAISEGTNLFLAATQSGYQTASGLGSPQAPAIASALGSVSASVVAPTPQSDLVVVAHRRVHHDFEHGGSPPPTNTPTPVPTVPSPRSALVQAQILTSGGSGVLSSPGNAASFDPPTVSASRFSLQPLSAIARADAQLVSSIYLSASDHLTGNATSPSWASASPLTSAAISAVTSVATAKVQQAAGKLAGAVVGVPTVATNVVGTFIHANALAAFSDATAAFINQCAALPRATAATPTHFRAWAVTAGVLAADALLIAHWYATRPRRELDDEQEPGPEEGTGCSLFRPDELPAR